MPRSTVASALPKRARTASRKRKRLASMPTVAPTLDANDTMTVPHSTPKTAPPARVMIAAPGNESPVITT